MTQRYYSYNEAPEELELTSKNLAAYIKPRVKHSVYGLLERDATTVVCMAYYFVRENTRRYFDKPSDSTDPWPFIYANRINEIKALTGFLKGIADASYKAKDFSKLKGHYGIARGEELPEWMGALKKI